MATDTLWVSFRPQASSPRSADRRPAQVVDVTLRRRSVPFAMLKLGDGVRAFARVAIWTGINIDWIKRIGRLQLATIPRETLDLRARIPELAKPYRAWAGELRARGGRFRGSGCMARVCGGSGSAVRLLPPGQCAEMPAAPQFITIQVRPRPLPWPRCLHPCLRAHAFRSRCAMSR